MKINEQNAEEKLYPCLNCDKMRTKDEGGTVFTVCDSCWDIYKSPYDLEKEVEKDLKK